LEGKASKTAHKVQDLEARCEDANRQQRQLQSQISEFSKRIQDLADRLRQKTNMEQKIQDMLDKVSRLEQELEELPRKLEEHKRRIQEKILEIARQLMKHESHLHLIYTDEASAAPRGKEISRREQAALAPREAHYGPERA
jgi:peptidoglycan hydrolase CwlO-like protein